MNDKATWDDYKNELDNVRIGPLILKELQRMVKSQCRKKNPNDFGFSDWTDNLDDLVNEVVAIRLIGLNQIDYIADVATDLNHFLSLLHNEVVFTFSKLRINTLELSIADRLTLELTNIGWSDSPNSGGQQDPSEVALQIEKILFDLPRLPNRGESRQSPLIASANLAIGAARILEIDKNVSKTVILLALRRYLTKIQSSVSQLHAGTSLEAIEESLNGFSSENDALENLQAEERNGLAMRVLEGLDDIDIECLHAVGNKMNQSELGARIGLTRQTTAKRVEKSLDSLRALIKQAALERSAEEELVALIFEKIGVRISGKKS